MSRSASLALLAMLTIVPASCSKRSPQDTNLEQSVSETPQRASPDPEVASLSTSAASTVAKAMRLAGLPAEQSQASVSMPGKALNVLARINNRVEQNGRHILAAEFDVSIGGTSIPALLTGAVGIGDTAKDARDTVASEWAAQYGVPIGFAVADVLGPKGTSSDSATIHAKVELEQYRLFHGPVGLRGEARDPSTISSDEFVKQMAATVVTIFNRTRGQTPYRSAIIQVVVTGTAATGGECRVDGAVSGELLRSLSQRAWPEASPSYMFKLFFVGSTVAA